MYLKDLNLIFLTVVALLFLSLNSIFCKWVLMNNYLDAYSFTFFRAFFAAITLVTIFYLKKKSFSFDIKGNYLGSFMLFLYLICFSFAYINIDAGFGTLLLFAVVQVFLFLASLYNKEKITSFKIFGMTLAFIGLVVLLYPKEELVLSYFHIFLMIISGLGWAVYSYLAKGSSNALEVNMDSFIKATIFTLLYFLLFINVDISFSYEGLALAFISGAITSGLGYVLWYKVAKQIEIFTSSVLQLLVPLISIFISVLFLNEAFTSTLFISSLLIGLGVFLSVYKRKAI